MDGVVAWGNITVPQVVIVDNDALARRTLLMMLKSRGFEVKAYALGQSLIADAGVMCSDLLISESQMPDMDAFSLRAALTRMGWGGIAIMVTGNTDPVLESRAINAGFASFISKPYREHSLVDRILDLLGTVGSKNRLS